MTATLTDEIRREIDDAVRGASQPDIVIRGVTIDERGEPQDVYILVEVKLARPTSESWPPDEFYQLRRQIRSAVAHSIGPEVDFRLTYVPDDDEPDAASSGTQA